MITKTQVDAALLATEAVCGGDTLSMAPVAITQGQLAVLIEAAKCAQYRCTDPSAVDAKSNSELVLREK